MELSDDEERQSGHEDVHFLGGLVEMSTPYSPSSRSHSRSGAAATFLRRVRNARLQSEPTDRQTKQGDAVCPSRARASGTTLLMHRFVHYIEWSHVTQFFSTHARTQ